MDPASNLYPKLGPGMMWERCRDRVVAGGGVVLMESPVTGIHRGDTDVEAVSFDAGGTRTRIETSHVISSMALSTFGKMMDPAPPSSALAAAEALKYRDFLTVALVVPEEKELSDNWIYVHHPSVRDGRIQNFGRWSPFLVKDERTCLGLEYFVLEGDDLWSASDTIPLPLPPRN